MDVAPLPWPAARLRPTLLGLWGEHDRLQLEADHDRGRLRAQRRAVRLPPASNAGGGFARPSLTQSDRLVGQWRARTRRDRLDRAGAFRSFPQPLVIAP